jgi:hypothetical protein
LFENKLTLQYNATIDPYTYDKETLRRIPVFEYKETGRIGRVTSTRLSAGLRLRSAQGGKRKDGEVPITEYTDVDEFGNPMGRGWGPAYVDFSIPWRFNLDYSFNTSYTGDEKRLDQTLRINGDISLTDKWKVIYRTGYDFKAEDFTQSSLTITRNLHCWQMSLNIVPFGTYQSYTFNINVTSSILQDLKWKKRESWYDR